MYRKKTLHVLFTLLLFAPFGCGKQPPSRTAHKPETGAEKPVERDRWESPRSMRYVIRVNGEEVGSESVRCAKTADGYEISFENVRQDINTRFAGRTALDGKWALRRFESTKTPLNQEEPRKFIEMERAGEEEMLECARFDGPEPVRRDAAWADQALLSVGSPSFWQILVNRCGGRFHGSRKAVAIEPLNEAFSGEGAQITLSLRANGEHFIRLGGKSLLAERLLVLSENFSANVWFDSSGAVVKVTVLDSPIRLTRITPVEIEIADYAFPEGGAAQAGSGDYPCMEEEVRVPLPPEGAEEMYLAAAVTMPEGLSEGERRPACLLIADYPFMDRDGNENALRTDILKDIARYLASRGYVVLRYDQRGLGAAGRSSDFIAEPSFGTMVDDARAALGYLSGLACVDPERVHIIAHGLGAMAAVKIASDAGGGGPRSEPLRSIVVMGCPGEQLYLVFCNQMAAAMNRRGLSDMEINAALSICVSVRAAIAECDRPGKDKDWRANRLHLLHGLFDFPTPFFLGMVKCPVLILQGGKDWETPPQNNGSRLRDAMERAGRKDYLYRGLLDMDHFLLNVKEEAMGICDYYDMDRRMSRQVLEEIRSWLNSPGPPAQPPGPAPQSGPAETRPETMEGGPEDTPAE